MIYKVLIGALLTAMILLSGCFYGFDYFKNCTECFEECERLGAEDWICVGSFNHNTNVSESKCICESPDRIVNVYIDERCDWK